MQDKVLPSVSNYTSHIHVFLPDDLNIINIKRIKKPSYNRNLKLHYHCTWAIDLCRWSFFIWLNLKFYIMIRDKKYTVSYLFLPDQGSSMRCMIESFYFLITREKQKNVWKLFCIYVDDYVDYIFFPKLLFSYSNNEPSRV